MTLRLASGENRLLQFSMLRLCVDRLCSVSWTSIEPRSAASGVTRPAWYITNWKKYPHATKVVFRKGRGQFGSFFIFLMQYLSCQACETPLGPCLFCPIKQYSQRNKRFRNRHLSLHGYSSVGASNAHCLDVYVPLSHAEEERGALYKVSRKL